MAQEQLLETLYAAINEALANVHTATIGKVVAVGETTVSVKPVFARMVDGVPTQLPTFENVPPFFLRGGGSYTAHPITVGDYALLVFTERCFDAWYSGKDNQPPPDFRMHDYSDGFALCGISPLGGAIPIPGVVRRVGDSEVTGNYEHEGDYVLTGNFTINGNLTVNGDAGGSGVVINNQSIQVNSGNIRADTVSLKSHVHNGVQPGGGNTGNPVP